MFGKNKLGKNPEQTSAIPGEKPTMTVEECHEMLQSMLFGLRVNGGW